MLGDRPFVDKPPPTKATRPMDKDSRIHPEFGRHSPSTLPHDLVRMQMKGAGITAHHRVPRRVTGMLPLPLRHTLNTSDIFILLSTTSRPAP